MKSLGLVPYHIFDHLDWYFSMLKSSLPLDSYSTP
jgi:hypothetical protein